MKTVKVKLYKFNELPENVQQKIIERNYDRNVDYNWWESVYDDAKEIGLKITEFDIDRGSSVKAKFIDSAENTAHKIIDNHGEMCETYKTAQDYLQNRDNLIDTWQKDENGDFEDEYELDNKLDELDADFLKSICEDYRIILQKEYEYLTSKEAIIESIMCDDNDYTIKGDIF